MGRERELAAISALLESARAGRSGALVVTGEPGIGKTALLECAVEAATGLLTLWTVGTENEAALSHAGLLTLLSALRHRIDQLPAPQASALGQVLGWNDDAGGAPSPLLVAGATVAMLSAGAAQRPLLVVVDDAQWLDQASATALFFAVRRMRDDPVAFLIATREPLPEQDLPELALHGLGLEDLRQRWPELGAAVATRLLTETRGNPLVLDDLVARLSAAQRAGAAPLPDPLPVPVRPAGVLARRLAGLSEPAARLVLLHACAGPGEEQVVSTAAASVGVLDDHVLDEAIAARALARRGGVVQLEHPLLRTVVFERVGDAERRAAHAALAAAAEETDRSGRHVTAVWHRAAAATGPDEALARALVAVADDRRAGSRAVASLALERASALTSDAETGWAWLARAAEESFLAGDLPRTRTLADRVLATSSSDHVRARVLFVLGTLEEYAGSVTAAASLLAEAADLARGVLQVRVLSELGLTRFRQGDLAGFVACTERISAVADLNDPYQRMLERFGVGWSAALAGDLPVAAPALAEALDLAKARRVTDTQTLMVYQAGVFADDLPGFVRHGAERADQVRRDGLAGLLVSALAMLSGVRATIGDHAGAFADAGEAVELARHLGQVADAASAHERLAWQSAARGLHEAAAESLHASAALLDRAGLSAAAAHHALNAAFCALCRDDLDEVVALLQPRLAVDGGMGEMGEPLGVAPLLVEALVGLGRHEEAAQLSADLDAVTPPGAPPMLEAPRQLCRALTAPDDAAALRAFGAATAAFDAVPDVFEAARVRLLVGSFMRRRGDRREARAMLADAEAAFTRLDLTAWVQKARAERAATGEKARRRESNQVDEPLTSQETRVALLVARGFTNKEVAAHLFLSPRTVETHLAAVFRKRGYRNRAALAAGLLQLPDEPS